ncbi:MAG: FHA domain-containing protein [Planctomycetaceae bacterium]|jgi:pSer/pThr/pTyr-binding forkhead associated (FHA) protein|nr:FHA domain-containing protein [Planctomycetaceae bacterium]
MSIKLVVDNEKNKGHIIAITRTPFMIGRGEDCELKSKSKQVSRRHCQIRSDNDVWTVSDNGSQNGVFINNIRIQGSQLLKNGDRLTVGPHCFIVQFNRTQDVPEESPFELTSLNDESSSNFLDSSTAQVAPTIISKPKAATDKSVQFEVKVDGHVIVVAQSRLFELALAGKIASDDLVSVGGRKVFADEIQGIVFGKSLPWNTHTAGVASQQNAPVEQQAVEPFNADGLPFDMSNEPFVRIARKEKTSNIVWNFIDPSFSRIYPPNNYGLVIHGLKTVYYIVILLCVLGIFSLCVNSGVRLYNDPQWQEKITGFAVSLAFTTFGSAVLLVTVRGLFEMLIMALLGSKPEDRNG